jgi:hypothetical protein
VIAANPQTKETTIRIPRLLFGLPFACLMLGAAAIFAAPLHPAFDTAVDRVGIEPDR